MIHRILTLAVLAVLFASGPLHAACYADYKAKRDNPLRLHYGVIRLDAQTCSLSDAVTREVGQRLSQGGWELLGVQSVFEDDGLAKRERDAGEFFLRF